MIIPFSLVSVVFESHESNSKKTQSQDYTTKEAWSIKAEIKQNNWISFGYLHEPGPT